MPSARVSRPGSSSHVGISWERGGQDGASGLKGMGRGGALSRRYFQAFCLGQGHMTRTFTMCSWVHWGCGVEFWAKAQGLECPVYLPWPQRGCVG